VVGFSIGADDYVTKPFSVKVLLQRIKALQRRADPSATPPTSLTIWGAHRSRAPPRQRRRRRAGPDATEFRLLECMLRQPGRAFSRPQLMDVAIGEGAIVLERTIDVHIKTLRKKLGSKQDSSRPCAASAIDFGKQNNFGVGAKPSMIIYGFARASPVCLYQPHPNGKPHQSRHVVNVEPLHELGAVCFHRLGADAQEARHLLDAPPRPASAGSRAGAASAVQGAGLIA